MKGINRFIFYINVGVIFLTLLSYLAPYVNPNSFWPIAFLGLGYPILLILNGIFILLWILIKPSYALVSLLCIGIGWKPLYNLYALPTHTLDTTIEQPNLLKIGSYNISQLNRINHLEGEKKEARKIEFKNFLEHHDLDILCLQEVSLRNMDDIRRSLDIATFFHHDNYTGIISKYPITRNGTIKDDKDKTFAVWSDIEKGDTTYRVYSAYLQSNLITKDASQLIKAGDLQEPKTWERVKLILGKYKAAIQFRAEDIILLKSHIRDSPHPVILAGDFNDVPHSYIYNQLSTGLFDTFHFSKGMQSTYGGDIPLLRIDYILVSRYFNEGTFSRELVEFSDHFPVIATLAP